MSNDFITLNLKKGGTIEIPRNVSFGIMPDPKGSKLVYLWPHRVLVKETVEQIIALTKENKS